MSAGPGARDAVVMLLDLAKPDQTIALGGRTFAVRDDPDRRTPPTSTPQTVARG
jgi:hypothetical protein